MTLTHANLMSVEIRRSICALLAVGGVRMKFFYKALVGGKDSGVTGYFLIEVKSLFSVVLLRFERETREVYHSHAFNALILWLWGSVIEHDVDGSERLWSTGAVKYTLRSTFHKVEALKRTWALSFRGSWVDHWYERRNGELVTLTHGREVV